MSSTPTTMMDRESKFSSSSDFDISLLCESPALSSASGYDRSRRGYLVALAGIVVSFLVGGVALAGCIFLVVNNQGYALGYFDIHAREALSLLLNAFITASTDATGYVHATTLRWALARERRLHFNANLRLLHAAKSTWSNGLIVNILYALTLVLAYTSTSTLIVPAEDITLERPVNFLISALPVGLLSACLLIQASLASWQLLITYVPTWSSNPVTTTQALVDEGLIERRSNRCMLSLAHTDTHWIGPQIPSSKQPSIWEANISARRVVRLAWSLVPIGIIWGSVVCAIILHANLASAFKGQSVSLFPSDISWELDTNWTWDLGTDKFSVKGFTWCLMIVAIIQALATIAVHCCELVVVLSRDESLWRRATTNKGLSRAQNPVISAMSSWQSVGLTISKALVHWLFGFAMNVTAGSGIVFRPWNIFYLSAFMLIVSLFVSYIAFRRPSGPQPAAYGHVQTIVDLVDEWPSPDKPRIYWGHKSGEEGEICHAGTSTSPLPCVKQNHLYAGVF